MTDEIKKRIEQVKNGEVPEGYQIQHGYVVPAVWMKNTCKLSDKFSRIKQKNNVGSTNVLTISAQQGLINQEDYYKQYVASEEKSNYSLLYSGDFAYNKSYSTGYDYGAIKRLDKYEMGIVSPLYICFRKNSDTISDYYTQYFESGIYNREIYKIAQEGARNHGLLNVAVEDFFDGYLINPPVAEQEGIAKILTHCDKVIELKKQLIAEERRQKRWLMEKLLIPDSDVRLPGFKGSWSNRLLSSLGHFSKGTGISNDDCASGEIPCIKYGDIYMSYDAQFTETVSYAAETAVKASPKVQSGTLLFTGSGEDRMEIGKCTAYMGNVPIAVGGDIIIMHPDCRKADPIFLSYQQDADNLIKQKARLAQGYSIVHLYADHIKELQVALPPTMEEQNAIANILSTTDREIELLEQELEQWQQKKKSLMQLLLTGIVRVNV